MDELFSCRNCVHNCGQSLLIGRNEGFCIKHDSVLLKPHRSTCKYLHRKDLPRFVVDEGLREHAGEFAGFSAIADLAEHTPIERLPYSEKFMWATDQLNGALAELDWSTLRIQLDAKVDAWTDQIMQHAKSNGAFFPPQPQYIECAEITQF